MRYLLKLLFLILLLYPSIWGYCGQVEEKSGNIHVEVTGLRNDTGLAKISLFGSKEGFPSDMEKALAVINAKIEEGRAKALFKNIRYGEYAIGVLHDESENGKMDFKWNVMPAEGHGASNNPKTLVGPPSFGSAGFRLESKSLTIKIKIQY